MKATYDIDGIPLDDPARRWYLEKATRRRGIPGKVSQGIRLPNRHGELTPNRAIYLPGQVGMKLIVTDRDDTGHRAGATQAAHNRETIAEILGQNQRSLEITERIPGPTPYERTARGHVNTAIEAPQLDQRLTRYEIPIVIEIPDVFWTDGETDTTIPITGTTTTHSIPALAAATAPIQAGTIRVRGPFTRLELRNMVADEKWAVIPRTGLIFEGAVGADQYVFIDLDTLDARVTTSSTAWETGGADVSAQIDYPPEGALELIPARFARGSLARDVRVRVQATGAAGTTAATIRAPRRYL